MRAFGAACLGFVGVRAVRIRAGLVAAVGVLVLVSCRQAPPPREEAVLLPSGRALRLSVSALASDPERYVTSQEEIVLRVSFDPELVELERVDRFVVWAQDPSTGLWDRLATSESGAREVTVSLPTGTVGLRASAVYEGGEEALTPQPGHSPLAWLHVDRSAPRVHWVSPDGTLLARRNGSYLLTWSAEDEGFGLRGSRLEYSTDGGVTWIRISDREPSEGQNRFLWRPPNSVRGDILVRVSVTDAAGNPSDDLLTIPRHGLRPGEPEPGSEGGVAVAARTPGEGDGEGTEAGTDGAGTDGADIVAASGDVTEAGVTGAVAAGDTSEAGPAAGGTPGSPDATSDDTSEGRAGASSAGPVALVPPESTCVKGGSELPVRWSVAPDSGIDPDERIALEFRLEGEEVWTLAAESHVGSGEAGWTVPDVSDGEARLRLVVGSGDDAVTHEAPEPIRIDSVAPTVRIVELPEALPADARLKLEFSGEGCGTVQNVRVYLRGAGDGDFWDGLDSSKVSLTGRELRLDLAWQREGDHDIFIAADDGIGNGGLVPGPGSEVLGTFRLDTAPPRLAVSPSVVPWVAGLSGEVDLEFDPSDCAPPLVIEGREPGAEWTELKRLSGFSAIGSSLSFPVAGAVRSYQVRVAVKDEAGNWRREETPVRVVESPISLETFLRSGSYETGTTQNVRWALHPAARDLEGSLTVRVDHQRELGGAWEKVRDGLAPARTLAWLVPEAISGEQRLRVRLYRGEDLLGEQVSEPFRVVTAGELGGAGFTSASMAVLGEARLALARFDEIESGAVGLSGPAREEAARDVEARLRRAIELDETNDEATYELALFISRVDPEARVDESIDLLQKTLALSPDHAAALNDLGAALIRKGDYERAKSPLSRSLELSPTARARYNLALVEMATGETERARAGFDEILAMDDPEGVAVGDVHYYRAYSSLLEGRPEEARSHLDAHRADMPGPLIRELEAQLGDGSPAP